MSQAMPQEKFLDWAAAAGFVTEGNAAIINGVAVEFVDLHEAAAVSRFSVPPKVLTATIHFQSKSIDSVKVEPSRMVIFSDEWEKRTNQWKSAVLAGTGVFTRRVGARECKVHEVDQAEGREFLSENHVQGSNKLSLVYFGLYLDGELLGLASLGRHNRHTTYNLVLLDRLCFKSGVQVVGGASRLLKSCAKWALSMHYDEIVSFSDNRWSDGKIYQTMGMEVDVVLRPDYFYVSNGKIITKQSQKKSATGCPAGMTELEWATSRGLVRLYDFGKKRWALNLHPEDHETRKEIRSRRCAERQQSGDFNNSYIRGYFRSEKNNSSIYYASTYELRCLFLLEKDDKVLAFKRCDAVKIEDRWRNPDLWVTFVDGRNEVWEVKAKTTLELAGVKEQIGDSVSITASLGVGFRLWTEDHSQLGGPGEIASWARKYIAEMSGDISLIEKAKENNRNKSRRFRSKLSADRVEIQCEHCMETHNIRRVTYEKNIAKHGSYICKPLACKISGKTPKLGLRKDNPYAAEGKKKCNTCGEVLEIDRFAVKTVARDGRRCICKDCVSAGRKTRAAELQPPTL